MADTIFALSTPRGRSGVAVIRVSGPEALAAAGAMVGRLPDPRKVALRLIRDPGSGEVLDEGVVLIFPEGESYTGEASVEFQLHGSLAVQDSVLTALSGMPGLRAAEPGEFTRRALDNNRLDLTQIEGLADLIDAETGAQRRQALQVMRGAIGELSTGWRRSLVRALSLLEATIDFSDEELPEDLADEADALTRQVIQEMRAQIAGAEISERVRDGFEVALVGAPNVGKSTLLNRLVGRDAAITSEVAGTTRDVIEVRMNLAGLPVTFLDTAGVRETDDHVEIIGVSRTKDRAAAADLRVFLTLDGTLGELAEMVQDGDLVLRAKADLAPGGGPDGVSGKTGEGLDSLLERVMAIFQNRATGATVLIRERHRVAIGEAVAALEQAREHLRSPELVDLAAEDYRVAVARLDALVGKVDVEDLLDEIFASFCLGK